MMETLDQLFDSWFIWFLLGLMIAAVIAAVTEH